MRGIYEAREGSRCLLLHNFGQLRWDGHMVVGICLANLACRATGQESVDGSRPADTERQKYRLDCVMGLACMDR